MMRVRETGKRIIFSAFYLYMSIYLPVLFEWEYRGGQLSYLSENDFQIWKKAFLDLLKEHFHSNYGLSQRELLTAFPTARIETVRYSEPGDPQVPIVVLCVKNDLNRIKMLVAHYRKQGVKQFAIIDNGSTDGTFEWMLEQTDIDIYKTTEKYSSLAKEAWVNRIISIYGLGRWYIQTDSDELVKYIGMESHSLRDVVRFAEARGYDRLEALTIDVYSSNGLYAPIPDKSSIEEEYSWMDTDSYEDKPKKVGNETIRWLTGGPRKRKMNVSTSLMKFPLAYFKAGTISANAHFLYPYNKIDKVPCCLGIMHYKFLPEDKTEYIARARKGSGFAFGGGYYRNYTSNTSDCETFMYEHSRQYVDSNSLRGIPYIEPIEFEEK